MNLYMVGKLAPNSTHFTSGLVKDVPGRGYFRAIPSQHGDKFATPPPPQSLNDSMMRPYADGWATKRGHFINDEQKETSPLLTRLMTLY